MKRVITLILLGTLLVITGACTLETPRQTKVTITPVDTPSLSSQDAISIAKEHSVASPLNLTEKRVGVWINRGSYTKGWNSQYIGNGKWTVELRVRNDNNTITSYRWSVFEPSLIATFLGAITE